jgi:hypothetical protein
MLSNPERETVKSPFFYWSSEGPCQAAVTDSKKPAEAGFSGWFADKSARTGLGSLAGRLPHSRTTPPANVAMRYCSFSLS